MPTFITEFNLKAKRQVSKIPQQAWQQLNKHDWPGNVRELRNVIERCVLFAEDNTLPPQWLQLETPLQLTDTDHADSLIIPLDGSMDLDAISSKRRCGVATTTPLPPPECWGPAAKSCVIGSKNMACERLARRGYICRNKITELSATFVPLF